MNIRLPDPTQQITDGQRPPHKASRPDPRPVSAVATSDTGSDADSAAGHSQHGMPSGGITPRIGGMAALSLERTAPSSWRLSGVGDVSSANKAYTRAHHHN